MAALPKVPKGNASKVQALPKLSRSKREGRERLLLYLLSTREQKAHKSHVNQTESVNQSTKNSLASTTGQKKVTDNSSETECPSILVPGPQKCTEDSVEERNCAQRTPAEPKEGKEFEDNVECPKNGLLEADEWVRTIHLTKIKQNVILVDIKINQELNVRSLIDTGSEVTILTSDPLSDIV